MNPVSRQVVDGLALLGTALEVDRVVRTLRSTRFERLWRFDLCLRDLPLRECFFPFFEAEAPFAYP